MAQSIGLLMQAKKKPFLKRYKNGLLAAMLLGIPMLWWVLLGGIPLIFGMGLGFFKWEGVGAATGVGFANYKMFFTNEFYFGSLLRSLWIGGLCLIVGLTVSLFFAAAINKMIKMKAFFRSVWYIPTVISPIVATMILNIFIDPTNGMINNLLMDMGKKPIFWLNSVGWSVFWIVVYSTWKSLGGSILLWLAAFQSVDKSLNEAASLDGANRRQTFWRIEIPQMMPLIVYILITGIGSAVQIYEQILFITGGGPRGQTEVLAYRIWVDTFGGDMNFGMAGASSVIMMLVTFVFVLFIFKRQKADVKKTGGDV